MVLEPAEACSDVDPSARTSAVRAAAQPAARSRNIKSSKALAPATAASVMPAMTTSDARLTNAVSRRHHGVRTCWWEGLRRPASRLAKVSALGVPPLAVESADAGWAASGVEVVMGLVSESGKMLRSSGVVADR